MDKDFSNSNQAEDSIEMGINEQKNSNDNASSDEDESYKSCNDPFSSSNAPLLIDDEEDEEEEQNNKAAERYPEPESAIIRSSYPPDISEDSADTFSDNGSDEIYYSEIENNENDSDISNPAQENTATNQGEVEVSFQRELLDYLGSFLNMESRFRLRENRQTVEVSEEQLNEYGRLRNKVNQDLKVLGVGNCKDLSSSDQNIALNLYFLLAGRERGDWTSCRRSSRVVPMWSFEKRERVQLELPSNDSKIEEIQAMEIIDPNKESGKKIDGRKSRNSWRTDGGPVEKKTITNNPINNVGHEEKYSNSSLWDTIYSTSPGLEIEENPVKPEKLVFKTTQKVKYLKDVMKKRSGKSIGDNEASRPVTEKISAERVQTNGLCDLKSAIYASRWAVRRLGLEIRFPAHEGCVNALHFSSNGHWIASGSDDRNIVVTDWQHHHQLSRFTVGHSSNIFQVRFLPGSNDLELVSCSRDSTVRYAALSSTGQLQYSRLLTRHKDCCHKLAVPIDQPCLVISASEDTRVLAADVRAPHTLGKICKVDKVPLYSISCNPVRSQEFAVAGKDSRVFIYDRRKPTESLFQMCPENLTAKPRNSYHVTSVAYSRTGQSILASYNDDDIYLFSTGSRPERAPSAIRRYQGHRNVQTVTGVSFYGPQHEYVVSGSNDGHVLVWERDSEALVNWFRADENGVVNVLESHPTMPILATAGLDHDVKMWSMLGADSTLERGLPLDQPLLERDAETSRIDFAWKTLDDRKIDSEPGPVEDNTDGAVPFNLRDLKVITALNWKMRDESYPYSIDNNLDNLIFMSRRHRGEIFLSDSDSADSYESVPDLNGDRAVPGSSDRSAAGTGAPSSRTPRPGRDPAADPNRPDGCRSS